MVRTSTTAHSRLRGCKSSTIYFALIFSAVAIAEVNSERISISLSSSAFIHHTTHKRKTYNQLSSSSSSSSNAWGEVLQNAISSLDKRQNIQEDRREKQRRRIADNNNVNNENRNRNNSNSNSHIQFVSPLLEDGYPPAVLEYEQTQHYNKPIILYLPGFDGTILSPFLQFPSLGETFDIRAMKVSMEDRSSFEELKDAVIQYLFNEVGDNTNQAIYLMGESFGGILATEVALELSSKDYDIELRGLILVNPATCYLRSALYELGPPVADAEPIFPALADIQYVVSLVTKLGPLFGDEGRFINQLLTILSSKGLPAVVNNAQREAYMGRVAFDLLNRLKFMPKDTLKWRLEEWLLWGSGLFEDRLEMLQTARDVDDNTPGGMDTYAMLKLSQELRTLIIAGEFDLTLPSLEEADRLSSELFRQSHVHVVPGAGHASTCGGSLNLIQLLRDVFPELKDGKDGGSMAVAENESGGLEKLLHGLEPRYDGASIGLNPLLYWSKAYYRKWRGE